MAQRIDADVGDAVGGCDYPRNWREFEQFFSTERACILYLEQARWPEGFRCTRCGHDRYWLRESDRRLLCANCRYKTSLTAGTLFEGTRMPIRTWFLAIWRLVEQTNGVGALGVQRALGLGSYQTAWAWMHKLRRAMVPTSGRLRGTIEVDESFIGGVEVGVRGRLSRTKAKVIIAVEHHGGRGAAGRVRMRRIHDFKSDTLVGFVRETCEPGSTIVTDGLSAYRPLRQFGYLHVSHNIKVSDKQAHELMPAVHRVSAEVKRWLLGTHQGAVSLEQLDYYLAEFSFRFNRRYSHHRGRLFYALVINSAHTPPRPYAELLSKGRGARQRERERKNRKRRAGTDERMHNPAVPRSQPKRPGGSRSRLPGGATPNVRREVPGRRGAPRSQTMSD
jgi:transposase-like protein